VPASLHSTDLWRTAPATYLGERSERSPPDCTVKPTDWSDALVGAGLGDEDWPTRLDALLGTDDR